MTISFVEKVELSGASLAVSFNSIPDDAVDLLILASIRFDSQNGGIILRFNDDISSSYGQTWMRGNGSFISQNKFLSATSIFCGNAPGGSASPNTYGNYRILVSNYTASETKSVQAEAADNIGTTSGNSFLGTGEYRNNSVISKILLKDSGSSNIAAGSFISLYKVTA